MHVCMCIQTVTFIRNDLGLDILHDPSRLCQGHESKFMVASFSPTMDAVA